MAHPQPEEPAVPSEERQEKLFAKFFAALYPAVRSAAYARTSDWQDAEDLAEEVFTAAWRRRAEAVTTFTAEWAFGTLHNMVGNEYRRRVRARRRMEQFASNLSTAPQPGSVDDSLLVRATVAGLTQADQHLLQMAYWDDWTREQMAEALGCSNGAVKTRVSRALGRLRRLFQKMGDLR